MCVCVGGGPRALDAVVCFMETFRAGTTASHDSCFERRRGWCSCMTSPRKRASPTCGTGLTVCRWVCSGLQASPRFWKGKLGIHPPHIPPSFSVINATIVIGMTPPAEECVGGWTRSPVAQRNHKHTQYSSQDRLLTYPISSLGCLPGWDSHCQPLAPSPPYLIFVPAFWIRQLQG